MSWVFPPNCKFGTMHRKEEADTTSGNEQNRIQLRPEAITQMAWNFILETPTWCDLEASECCCGCSEAPRRPRQLRAAFAHGHCQIRAGM